MFLLLFIVVGMIILLVVKPKRHRPPDLTTPKTPPVSIDEGGIIARPLDMEEPDGTRLEGLDAEENGAPSVVRRLMHRRSRSFIA